jgi:hypothetical protein
MYNIPSCSGKEEHLKICNVNATCHSILMMWQSQFQNTTSSINLWKYCTPTESHGLRESSKSMIKTLYMPLHNQFVLPTTNKMWNSMSRWIMSIPTDHKYGNYIHIHFLFFRLCLTTFRHHKSTTVPLWLWNSVGLIVWRFYSLIFT